MLNKTDLTVAICGGGNLAHASIATIGHLHPGFKITMFSTRPEIWANKIVGETKGSAWESKGELTGTIHKCSANPAEVIPNADVIIICSPAHTKIDVLQKIKPFIKTSAFIGTIFGQGGFDLQCRYVLGEDIQKKALTIFSSQYVPFICKAHDYGKRCTIIGPKKDLYVTSYPVEKVQDACKLMTLLYGIPSLVVPNFLSLTLTPSNQIIHPGRVYSFFKNWDMKTPFDKSKMPLLYEEIDDDSANEI